MAARSPWLDGDAYVREALKTAHRARHNDGRKQSKARKAEVERLRADGQHERAAKLDAQQHAHGIGKMRRQRRREQTEAAIEGAKLKAALRRGAQREEAETFELFEAATSASAWGRRTGPVRDMYYEYIPRGLGSGDSRNYKKALKRSTARTVRWRSGEMARKIRYIVRAAALEPVRGNVLTNMGEDIEEAIACSRLLEALEEMTRENGGVYHHIIVGLPHELTSEQRAALLQDLVQALRDLKLPFCAALHHPDERGDQRNFHAHILVSFRPMERTADYEWEFAPSKRTWLDTTPGLHLQRKFVAKCFNRRLAEAGHDVRWAHESREARGLQTPGNNKKGPEYTRAERDQNDAEKALAKATGRDRDVKELLTGVELLARTMARLDYFRQSLGKMVEAAVQDFSQLARRSQEQVEALTEVRQEVRDELWELQELWAATGAQKEAVGRERVRGTSEEATTAPKSVDPPKANLPSYDALAEAERTRDLKPRAKTKQSRVPPAEPAPEEGLSAEVLLDWMARNGRVR